MDSRALEIEKSSASDKEAGGREVSDAWGDAKVLAFLPLCGRNKKLMITGDRNKMPTVGSFKLSSQRFCITRKLKMNMGLVLLQKVRR